MSRLHKMPLGYLRPRKYRAAETSEVLVSPTDFSNAAWGKGACSVTTGQTDPFGGTRAQSLIEDNTLNNHFITQTATGRSAGKLESFQVYAKAGARTWFALGDDSGAHWLFVNLSTGAAGTSLGLTASSIVTAGNSWWLTTVKTTAFDGAVTIWMASADNTTSYAGDGVSNILIYGAAARYVP